MVDNIALAERRQPMLMELRGKSGESVSSLPTCTHSVPYSVQLSISIDHVPQCALFNIVVCKY